jgi:hypothetical protein
VIGAIVINETELESKLDMIVSQMSHYAADQIYSDIAGLNTFHKIARKKAEHSCFTKYSFPA